MGYREYVKVVVGGREDGGVGTVMRLVGREEGFGVENGTGVAGGVANWGCKSM